MDVSDEYTAYSEDDTCDDERWDYECEAVAIYEDLPGNLRLRDIRRKPQRLYSSESLLLPSNRYPA